MRSLFIIFLVFAASSFYSQDSSSTDPAKKNKAVYSRARKASILSAVIPGAGQVYNRKYWKAPLIYAGFAGLGYYFYVNNNQFRYYRQNLIAEYDEDPATVNSSGYSGQQLQAQKIYFRRFRDFAAVGIAAIYIVNIIDANVDAHLRTFDISDDLSLRIDPLGTLVAGSTVTGLTITLNFR